MDFIACILLSLTDGWFPVAASDIMKSGSIAIDVLQDSQAVLITLPVVGLWAPESGNF